LYGSFSIIEACRLRYQRNGPVSWAKSGVVLIGGILGAAFATLSIDVFESDVNQIGYVAGCTIFGGIVCAITSASIPWLGRTSTQSNLSTRTEIDGRPQLSKTRSTNSPPLSPQ
jgi:hypothetical protein